jgi:hypothetical protein
MFSKPLAAGLLAMACVAAAAGAAYVAVRQNAGVAPSRSAELATTDNLPAPAAGPAVQDTEAVIDPAVPPEPALENAEPTHRQSGRSASEPRSIRSTPERRVERPASPRAEPAPSSPARAPDSAAGVTSAQVSAGEASTPPRTEPSAAEPAPADTAHVDRPARPSAPVFDELVVPAASVIGLQIETPVSSERAQIEDRVDARVLRDVAVDGRAAIPAGARAVGAVTLVDRGGKMKERARLEVRFHTLVLADGTTLPMRTEAIVREGDSPAGESARKIGGAAVGGAILGAIIGGKKGAVVGGATGAAGGSAAVMAGDRNAATLPVGAVVTVRLAIPVTVEVERR